MKRLNDMKLGGREAQFLLEEDGWFEGLFVDRNFGQEMIFGVYLPGKTIYFFRGENDCDVYPILFKATRDAKTYEGEAYEINDEGNEYAGKITISTRDVQEHKEHNLLEKNNRVVSLEADVLEVHLDLFKKTGKFKELYDNTKTNKAMLKAALVAEAEEKQATLKLENDM